MADKIDLIDIADVINEEIKKITAIINIIEISRIEFLEESTIPGLCHIMRYSISKITKETGKLRGQG